MSTIPYLSQGLGLDIDPATGMPRKKKAAQPGFTQGQVNLSLAANPAATFGPSPGVNYNAPGRVTVPGFTPDYKALIESALGPFQAQLGAEGIADASSRDAAFIRSLGQFGEQLNLEGARGAFGPQFVDEAGLSGVLPQANALAKQTTGAGLSYVARASKAHKDAVRQIRNTLAARGLLRSGELGYQLQEQQTQFDTGQYDARQQLADYLAGVQKGYVDAERARQYRLETRTAEEAPRQAALNPVSGTQEAVFVDYAPDGRPLYKRPNDGALIFQDGSVYTAAAAVPPVAPPPKAPQAPLLGIGSRQYQAF